MLLEEIENATGCFWNPLLKIQPNTVTQQKTQTIIPPHRHRLMERTSAK